MMARSRCAPFKGRIQKIIQIKQHFDLAFVTENCALAVGLAGASLREPWREHPRRHQLLIYPIRFGGLAVGTPPRPGLIGHSRYQSPRRPDQIPHLALAAVHLPAAMRYGARRSRQPPCRARSRNISAQMKTSRAWHRRTMANGSRHGPSQEMRLRTVGPSWSRSHTNHAVAIADVEIGPFH